MNIAHLEDYTRFPCSNVEYICNLQPLQRTLNAVVLVRKHAEVVECLAKIRISIALENISIVHKEM